MEVRRHGDLATWQMPAPRIAAQLANRELFKCEDAGPCVVEEDLAAAAPQAPFGWKSFRVVQRVDGLVALQTFHGSFLRVRSGYFVTLRRKDDAEGVGDSGHDDTGFEVVTHLNGNISMKGAGGVYLSALGNGGLACAKTITPAEHFAEIAHRDATISLRSFDGSLIDAERLDRSTKRLIVREQMQPQSFALVTDEGTGSAALRSFYGTYLSLGEGGSIEPWSASVGAGEKFEVESLAGDTVPGVALVRLKGSAGRYLTTSEEGYIVARGSASDECAAFHMTETRQEGGGESSVTLRTCKGGYLSVVVIPIHTFYMYRAQGGDDYPLANVNTANLGGVLWYLHNEVVKDSPRKFGITRITRFKVSTTSPDKLASRGMNFGVRFAYDSQKCTGAGPWNGPGSCDKYYQEYGNFVGCNLLGKYPFPMASQGFPVHYGGAKWYSLPKEGACKCEEGKACAPTGAVDCTYTAEWAGDIYLQDLEGIGNYDGFVGSGQKEYDQGQDAGVGNSFWNQKFDDYLCWQRIQATDAFFQRAHPEYPGDREMPEPDCDFSCTDFYRGITDGPPDDCNETLQEQKAAHFHPVSAPDWIWPPPPDK